MPYNKILVKKNHHCLSNVGISGISGDPALVPFVLGYLKVPIQPPGGPVGVLHQPELPAVGLPSVAHEQNGVIQVVRSVAALWVVEDLLAVKLEVLGDVNGGGDGTELDQGLGQGLFVTLFDPVVTCNGKSRSGPEIICFPKIL